MTLYDGIDAFKEMSADKVEGLGVAVTSLFSDGAIPEGDTIGNKVTQDLFGQLKTF